MQFTITSAAALALLGTAFAQTANFDAIVAPTKGQEVIADGSTSTTITWDPTPEYDEQTISIRLLQGASDTSLDFFTGANVASSIKSSLGSYTWTPDASIAGFATYGLKLQLDSDTSIFQYSFPFQVTAGSSGSNAGGSSKVGSSNSNESSSSPLAVSTSTSTASTPSSTLSPTNGSSGASGASTDATTASVTTTASAASATSGGGSGSSSTTLTRATTSATATGTSAGSTSTSPAQTAGASRVAAGGFAVVVGAVMAMLVL